jgi:hypothetical protein
LEHLGTIQDAITLQQGMSFGAVWTVYHVARRLGIEKALGTTREGKLALWQVMARVIDQGSRLSAVRLAMSHAACDVLGLGTFDEDTLYENLDWLADAQVAIEDRLYAQRTKPINLFLYDVTSSYFEGTQNELAAFGYNRDGKKGKRQIVIGLLCDEDGYPVSIEVFPGNTQDPQTFAAQITKVKARFGVHEITFVGDRGMIKGQQIEDLAQQGLHYITAITKPQIEKLLRQGTFQMDLFDQALAEVLADEGLRYVLRRNPVRAQEVRDTRHAKLATLQAHVAKQNHYLTAHPRANPQGAWHKLVARAQHLRIADWVELTVAERTITLTINEDAQTEAAKLDGCYVLKTDLTPAQAPKELVHDRYKDLASVEPAFRSCKTAHLEVRGRMPSSSCSPTRSSSIWHRAGASSISLWKKASTPWRRSVSSKCRPPIPPAITASLRLGTPSRAYCTAPTSRSPRPLPFLGCGCPRRKNFSLNVCTSEYSYLPDC